MTSAVAMSDVNFENSSQQDIGIIENDINFSLKYKQLLEVDSPVEHPNFTQLQKILDELRLNSEALYIYLIMPMKEGKAAIDGNPEGNFMLTIDGSAEIEDWGTVYEHEIQFTEAWFGASSVARSAWKDEEQVLWSAFAPIYDDEGRVIVLLGVDYPVTDLIERYPQWNRDDERWNGFTDEVGYEIPLELREKVEQIKELAQIYADFLSVSGRH